MKKGDIAVVVSVLLVCLLWFSGSFFLKADSLCAVIWSDGKIVKEVDFSDIEQEYTENFGDCTVLFSNDGVSFIASDCHDKLCVKHGKLSKSGDTMACIPNRIVITIENSKKEDFDAVAY